jgi:hypothetical protein
MCSFVICNRCLIFQVIGLLHILLLKYLVDPQSSLKNRLNIKIAQFGQKEEQFTLTS